MERISLIYKLLVLQILMTEVNSALDRLGVEAYKVSTTAQITRLRVDPPGDWRGEHAGIDGNLQTTNFTFSVTAGSKMQIFALTCLARTPEGEMLEDWRGPATNPATGRGRVTRQGAGVMAREWLSSLGFDMDAMERRYSARVEQLPPPPPLAGQVSCFSVEWGPRNKPGTPELLLAKVLLNPRERWPVRIYVRDLSYCREALPAIAHDVALSRLSDEPVLKFFGGGPISLRTLRNPDFTNVFAVLQTPPEYEAHMRAALLRETAEVLTLLGCDQVDHNKVKDLFVNPPAFGQGGRVEFDNGEIEFDSQGKLHLFALLPRGYTNHFVWRTQATSRITTNQALTIGLGKLAALGVDTPGLDRDYSRHFYQAQASRPRARDHKREWFDTPQYFLEWVKESKPGDPREAVVSAVVYGDIAQLGRLELNNTRYWTRPSLQPPAAR